MERLGSEVKRELARFGPAAGMAAIVEAWPDAVGPEIARNAWPSRIGRDGTLHVAASSSAWVFELTQLATEIHGRLRTALGSDAPRALRFAPGPLPEALVEASEAGERPIVRPSAAERARALELTSEVGDRDLREVLARAAAASLARGADDRRF